MVTQEPRERAVVTAGANAREPCAREAKCTRGETTVPIGLGPYPRSVLPENHWEALYEANAELIDDIVADLQRLAQGARFADLTIAASAVQASGWKPGRRSFSPTDTTPTRNRRRNGSS